MHNSGVMAQSAPSFAATWTADSTSLRLCLMSLVTGARWSKEIRNFLIVVPLDSLRIRMWFLVLQPWQGADRATAIIALGKVDLNLILTLAENTGHLFPCI